RGEGGGETVSPRQVRESGVRKARTAMDDDQMLALLTQISVGRAGRHRYRTPRRGLGAHRACVEPGERRRHGGDVRARGTARIGVEPPADAAHTRISAAGGWLRKPAGLAVSPQGPHLDNTNKAPTPAPPPSLLFPSPTQRRP